MKKANGGFVVFICFMAITTVHAQIPNAGFETWSAGSPTGWIANNIPGVDTVILRTTDAHSGTYAVEGIVSSVLSVAFPPALYIIFPWTTRPTTFSGYYKYSPVGGDTLLISAVFGKTSSAVGAAFLRTTVSVSSYTQFSIPITYVSANTPDSAAIFIGIYPASGSTSTHAGSTFKIDDLAFSGSTGVETAAGQTPLSFSLHQNYPNPFNPSTVIGYEIPVSGFVSLKVYDMLRRERANLVSEEQTVGYHQATLDATNFASGTYFYRLQAGSYMETKKLVLLK